MNIVAIFILCFVYVQCEDAKIDCLVDEKNPRVLVIGAGPSGIAAASRLLENGFSNLKILEAEDRIGGRVYSRPFGEYMIDLGGQWVHGQEGNVAFELAWPLGLLERSPNYPNSLKIQHYTSSGPILSSNISTYLFNYVLHLGDANVSDEDYEKLKNGTLGEYAELKLGEYFKDHPEIPVDLRKPVFDSMDMMVMAAEAADTWYELPVRDSVHFSASAGDQAINWKERTYGTILDILMKKYPNPELELPVENNTLKSHKVTKIRYNVPECPLAVVSTSNGQQFTADHVIFTASLGVLKATHQALFDPALPSEKINSIENIGFGHVGKIFLYYENIWWPIEDDIYTKIITWTEADRKELENDPKKRWMLGFTAIYRVEHKPKLICIWISSNYSTEMEKIPETQFNNQIIEFMNKFFGNSYNLTEPKEILRTTWNTNDNFRGTYSYRKLNSNATNASYEYLAMPVMKDSKPIVQFAGEATEQRWSTVHGAISSGWREADRLIGLYPSIKALQSTK